VSIKKLLFWPDTHRPYHSKRAVQVALQCAKAFKPDVLVILGDFADCYSVSAHDKGPDRVRHLRDEILDVNEGLDELDRLGVPEKHYVEGNHEYRLERYLMQKAPELFGLVDIPTLFRLKERGWKYTPYRSHLKLGKLHITHDVGQAGKYAIQRSLADVQGNIAIGHTHRIGYAIEGSARGDAHVGAMFGWLGDFDSIDYLHKLKALREWSHGLGVGYMESSGVVHLQPIPIIKDSAVVEGKLIKLDWRVR
jgi:predicted phosphodiesterase